MIKFEKFGETIKIRNDDWTNLRKRYDVEKAEWDGAWSVHTINETCPLCETYHSLCSSCPFGEFDEENNDQSGCVVFMLKLFKHLYFDAGLEDVGWSKRNNKLARKQLGQMLKMMDEIEASQ